MTPHVESGLNFWKQLKCNFLLSENSPVSAFANFHQANVFDLGVFKKLPRPKIYPRDCNIRLLEGTDYRNIDGIIIVIFHEFWQMQSRIIFKFFLANLP